MKPASGPSWPPARTTAWSKIASTPAISTCTLKNATSAGAASQVAPAGSLKIDPVNFHAFQEACAISAADQPLDLCAGKAHAPGPGHAHDPGLRLLWLHQHAHPARRRHLRLGRHHRPGNGGPGHDRQDAADRGEPAGRFEVHTREGHPFRWLHGPYKDPYLVTVYGEQLGLGSRAYELVDVFPVEKVIPDRKRSIFRQTRLSPEPGGLPFQSPAARRPIIASLAVNEIRK